MVLNELSLRTPANDVSTARQWMLSLIDTIQAAIKQGVARVLRTHSDFYNSPFAPNYTILNWRNDNEVDRELRRFFATLITKAPFLNDTSDSEVERSMLSECICSNQAAIGLGIALILESLAISLKSEQKWDACRVTVQWSYLNELDELINESIEVLHASSGEHIHEHIGWIKSHIREDVVTGVELWERREEFFPNLQFCEMVGEQLKSLQTGNLMLRPVAKRLFELEDYCQVWLSGGFDPEALPSKTTPESKPTLKQYGSERTFICPDGQARIFSWHVRLTPLPWRIH